MAVKEQFKKIGKKFDFTDHVVTAKLAADDLILRDPNELERQSGCYRITIRKSEILDFNSYGHGTLGSQSVYVIPLDIWESF